ncbi:uncharacterized protein HMPREF1541_08224 [Cyphellophora europaea CBS 101466]|uniref:Uncharacterized protein n=1 Tax=Cyphellophora europaea (strain CBS 101466) TaxID=1220924 RepID=W2RNC0_CYPE1|nr:uncharacterized protein HMPREF1541_08224 [Cyphellophora europaea CBS 101466]ETN37234.1 hypothetical protein HMPREF1541_08224 [Cyphellophora europaea CBS 101466]
MGTYTNAATRSPSLSDVTISDADSSTSSQDEFYLEKYSAPKANSATSDRNMTENKPKKRARPELNIVTHLPGSQARALDPDLTIAQVRAKKTAATTRPKSVVSSKAEHFDGSLLVERTKAFATIKNLAQARRDRKQARRDGFEKLDNEPSQTPEPPSLASHPIPPSTGAPSSVVIGISLPKHEAVAHEFNKDSSAVTLNTSTPTTPAIVITPAESEYPKEVLPAAIRGLSARRPRPVSSFYSDATFFTGEPGSGGNVPPVPRIPQIPSGHNRRSSSDESQPYSKQGVIGSSRRFSTESRERTLPPNTEDSRHKSQGWWSLSLSPMLSRAGTTKSHQAQRATTVPDIPPVPATVLSGRSRSGTNDSQTSPETPRRLGLAGIRASIWSHWTTEPKSQRVARDSINTTYPEAGDEDHDRDLSPLEAQDPLPRELPFQDSLAQLQPRVAGGLADDYYHACAIEQLSGQPYFECENHSCSEQWPVFRSVFDSDGGDNSPSAGGAARVASKAAADEQDDSGLATTAVVGVAGAAVGAVTAATALHQSDLSNASEPAVVSPHVRQADTGSVMQARAVENKTPPMPQSEVASDANEGSRSVDIAAPKSSSTTTAAPVPIPLSTPPQEVPSTSAMTDTPRPTTRNPNIAPIAPPSSSAAISDGRVISPGPVSPEMHQIMTSRGGVPMSEMRSVGQSEPTAPPIAYHFYGYPPAAAAKPVDVEAVKSSPETSKSDITSMNAKNPEKPGKPGFVQRLKSWAAKRKSAKSTQTVDKKKQRKHRCIASLIFGCLLLVIIGSILLATLLTRRGDRTPTQTQWLNLTGYPPIPTGISTIIRPDPVVQQSQCVQPATAWSCSTPPENQFEIAPNNPDQPNFRLEIKFRNGTVPANMTIPTGDAPYVRKRASDPFTNSLFEANPVPPSRADQVFIGNTTDNITAPFDGEDTPFYMSFIPVFPINPSDISLNATMSTSRLAARQQASNDSVADLVPPPSVDDSGLAAPANLLPTSPYPTAQPIRFYNRGLQDEHFGFYIYYDRSIFLSNDVLQDAPSSDNTTIVTPNNPSNGAGNSSDSDGGCARTDAKSRCTFSQTRFLVQVFTNPAFGGQLRGDVPEVGSKGAGNSATNYTPPGSFPYPTTITVDRHGGNVNKKAVYCYGVDGNQRIVGDAKNFLLEARGAGGSLVNAAPGLFLSQGDSVSADFDQGAGGIDGGTSGCKCAWQNWA